LPHVLAVDERGAGKLPELRLGEFSGRQDLPRVQRLAGPSWLMLLSLRFREALACAAELHAGQERKGSGVPYLAHLLAVASIVLDYQGSEDEAIAALLHDAVEDQGGAATLREIRRRFGDTVADIVAGCSDADSIPKPPWRQRKEAYLAHLPRASASVRLVSAADKLHNARALLMDYRQVGEAVWQRFNGGREGTLWYYGALVEALCRAGTTPVVEELQRAVRELQRLAGRSPACDNGPAPGSLHP
jgi:(p)ppGpp synthase/HD superfamily hydrolase